MSLPRPLQAVIFDMDGLLVDTETVVKDAMLQQAEAMGRELPEHVFRSMIGTNHGTTEHILTSHFGPSFSLDEFRSGWIRRYHALSAGGVVLKAGVVELIDLLDARGVPRAVCTSSRHEDVERNLIPHGLYARFQAVVANGDYARGKPAPDPFLKAAERLEADPPHCLALEDSHNGVRAAHAAGMMTVMVPDLLEATDEMQALCVRIAESLHEVRDLIAVMAGSEERT